MATQRTPFTDPNIQRQVTQNQINLVGFTQAPLVKILGIENEKRWKFMHWPPGADKKIEGLEDSTLPDTDTLASALTADDVYCYPTNPSYWQVGNIVKVDDEYVEVADKSPNGVLTLRRASGGSTAAAHSAAATMTRITIAKRHGANYALSYTSTVTRPYNYTQVLETAIQVDEGQQIATDWGVTDTMAYHLAKAIGGRSEVGSRGQAGSLLRDLCRIAYHDLRQEPSDTQTGIAGGLRTFITSHTYGGTTTALSRKTINQAVREVYEDAGNSDILVVSPYGAELIADMFEGSIRTERSEQRGGSFISYIVTPNSMGEIEIVRDHMCANTEMWLLDSTKAGWMTVRPFMVKEKPSMGDYAVNSVLGEYSFMVFEETSHALIEHSGPS